MSHFLARLAAAVAPQAAAPPRLQPMLGSIFAPNLAAQPLRSAESFPTAQEDPTSAPQHHAPTGPSDPGAASFSLHPAPAFTPLQEPLQETSQPGTHSENRSQNWLTDAPLLPRPSLSSPASFSSLTERTDPASSQPTTSPESVEKTSLAPASSQDNLPGVPSPYRPLVVSAQLAPPPPTLQPHPPAPSANIHRAEARRLATQPAPTTQPDEIHIHIGRIEVAAIQQQAPRPAPAPARHGLNLNDYLRRGNGSAR